MKTDPPLAQPTFVPPAAVKSAPRVALLGGGRMGRALIQGMIRGGTVEPTLCTISEPDTNSQSWWNTNLPHCSLVSSNTQAIQGADVILVAVKPDVVAKVAEEIRGKIGKAIVVSVAAGIKLPTLQTLFETDAVVRVMPNTPALVQQGACAFCCGTGVPAQAQTLVEQMLASVGLAVPVPDKWMDAVTGLSGSGPALVCLMIEALADGGVLAGLPRDLALKLAAQTVLGTAQMVLVEGKHPGELKDQVASPGGTTIAALQILEQSAVRGALMTAVKRAADRSAELGSK